MARKSSNRKRIVASVQAEMARRNDAFGFVAEGAVKRRSPVDTGRMRAAQTHVADENGVIIGSNVPYQVFVELGHRRPDGGFVPPQPHLVPGVLDAVASHGKAIYGEGMSIG
jgi:phage gpG-like protein